VSPNPRSQRPGPSPLVHHNSYGRIKRPVSNYEQYRRYALDCLGLANKTNDLSTRTLLVDMAQAWVKLAEQAAKNAEGQQSRRR
jgi:hypothetical protein